MRVLQIQSNAPHAMLVEMKLHAEGMKVFTTDLGEEGFDLAKVYEYELILLDLELPDMTGFDVLRRLRAAKIGTPVIFITTDGDIETKVKAFQLGADDYMVKPFHMDELVARARAISRRAAGIPEAVVQHGPLTVNLSQKWAENAAGERIHLTGKEFAILEALIMRRGGLVTRDALMGFLYNGIDEPEIKIVDVLICKVRKKLNDHGVPGRLIDTVWGRGYRICAPAEATV